MARRQRLLGLADLAKAVRTGCAKAPGPLHSCREKAENTGTVSFQMWGRLVLCKTEVLSTVFSCPTHPSQGGPVSKTQRGSPTYP